MGWRLEGGLLYYLLCCSIIIPLDGTVNVPQLLLCVLCGSGGGEMQALLYMVRLSKYLLYPLLCQDDEGSTLLAFPTTQHILCWSRSRGGESLSWNGMREEGGREGGSVWMDGRPQIDEEQG